MTARILATAVAGVLALAASPSLANGHGQGAMAPPAGGSLGGMATNPCLLGTAAPGQCVGPVQVTGGVMVQAPAGPVAAPAMPQMPSMPPLQAPSAGQVISGSSAGWQSAGSSYYQSSSSSASSSSQVVSSAGTGSGTGGSYWSAQSSGEVVRDGVPVRYSNASSGWGPAPATVAPAGPMPVAVSGPGLVAVAPPEPHPVAVQGGWAVPPAPPQPGYGVIAQAPTGPGCTQQMIAQRIPCPGEWVYASQPQPVPVVVHPAPLPAPLPAPVPVHPGPQGAGPLPLSFFAGGISNGVGFNTQEQYSYGGGGFAIVGGGTRFSGVSQRTTLTPPPRRPPHNPPPSHKPCGC